MVQVVIFVKSVQRCVALAQLLIEQNFPAIAIHRGMTQEERLSRLIFICLVLLSSNNFVIGTSNSKTSKNEFWLLQICLGEEWTLNG